MLAWFTVGITVFEFMIVAPLFRRPASVLDLLALPFIAFGLLAYFIGIRVGIWRAFGVEQIVIEKGLFSWTRTALFRRRKVELPVAEITVVITATPWHGLSNRVEFMAGKRIFRIGDMLRRDETYELAWLLRRAAHISE